MGNHCLLVTNMKKLSASYCLKCPMIIAKLYHLPMLQLFRYFIQYQFYVKSVHTFSLTMPHHLNLAVSLLELRDTILCANVKGDVDCV
jgi:hypothetical protein